jgi:hypothetical protein
MALAVRIGGEKREKLCVKLHSTYKNCNFELLSLNIFSL